MHIRHSNLYRLSRLAVLCQFQLISSSPRALKAQL
jgi:hypothetical protein